MRERAWARAALISLLLPYGPERIGRMIKLDFEATNDNAAHWPERF